jgi:uncharacterized protein (TIGR00290 family)
MKRRIALSWSGGKDSALALHALRRSAEHDVVALLTTMTREDGVVPMHEVPGALIRRQAAEAGLPLVEVSFPRGANNGVYESEVGAALARLKGDGVDGIAFGDLFLQDIRNYRERQLARAGMRGVFPLWGLDTSKLLADFMTDGFRSIVTCVDARHLPPAFAGRRIDAAFAADLPSSADPCGENGEYHSFCYRGPVFQNEIEFDVGQPARRGDFVHVPLKEKS